MPKVDRAISLRLVIQQMKPVFERAFKCKIDLYDPKSPTIAMIGFDYAGQINFDIHIFERDGEETFDFLDQAFLVDRRNMRAASVSLPRAIELLTILQLL